jgi:hypothetical protein
LNSQRPLIHETIPPLQTPIEGLYLANTTQIYPEDRGQNYSIRIGQQVAKLAMEDYGQRRAGDRTPPEAVSPAP